MGNCPESLTGYKCLSNGACNVCGLLSNKAEGCNIYSTSPVCDADKSTVGIEATYDTAKEAQCVACKQTGEHSYYFICDTLISFQNNGFLTYIFMFYTDLFQMVQQETGVILETVLHTILLINAFLLDRVTSVA